MKPVRIAIRGKFQVGKSTTINALTASTVARAGDGSHTTTRGRTHFIWGQQEHAIIHSPVGDRRVSLSEARMVNVDERTSLTVALDRDWLRDTEIIDVPGHGASGRAGVSDGSESDRALADSDAVVVIVTNRQLAKDILGDVFEPTRGRPLMVLMNCLYPDENPASERNSGVAREIEQQLADGGYWLLGDPDGGMVWKYNALWACQSVLRERIASGKASEADRESVASMDESIASSFGARSLPVPSLDSLRDQSRLASIAHTVFGRTSRITHLSSAATLSRAFNMWRTALVEHVRC